MAGSYFWQLIKTLESIYRFKNILFFEVVKFLRVNKILQRLRN
jgi:hypothetical protein